MSLSVKAMVASTRAISAWSCWDTSGAWGEPPELLGISRGERLSDEEGKTGFAGLIRPSAFALRAWLTCGLARPSGWRPAKRSHLAYAKRVAVWLIVHPCAITLPVSSRRPKVAVAWNASGPVHQSQVS